MKMIDTVIYLVSSWINVFIIIPARFAYRFGKIASQLLCGRLRDTLQKACDTYDQAKNDHLSAAELPSEDIDYLQQKLRNVLRPEYVVMNDHVAFRNSWSAKMSEQGVPSAEAEQVADIVMSLGKEVVEPWRKDVNDMKNKLDDLKTQLDNQKTQLDNQKTQIDNLAEQLKISEADLAGLKLRQLLNSVQRELYLTFFPAASANRNYRVSVLESHLKRDDEQQRRNREAKLNELLDKVGFQRSDEKNINKFITKYDLNVMPHPVVEDLTNENDLQAVLDKLEELADEDRAHAMRWARIYWEARDERQRNGQAYQ